MGTEMRVILAGYNVDNEVLEELKRSNPSLKNVTPETMAAAYARISRDPRSVDKLRAAARTEVERARRSNRNIIFKMGHHSVAEHAVFNFDIIRVSRLAIEEIEKFRLCSFTEKSQRYIKLDDDYIIPEEGQRAGQQRLFQETIKAQNALYHKLYRKLQPYFNDQFAALAQDPKKQAILNGWAKEVAPSIILFTEASDFDTKTYKELEALSRPLLDGPNQISKDLICLVDHTPDGDSRLIAALLHTSSTLPYEECLRKAKSLGNKTKKDLYLGVFRHMEFYDAVLREFEYIDLTFDLIISATCFAQLKRHRMATLTAQPYDPGLGITVPPSIGEVGAERELNDIIDRTVATHSALKQVMDVGAEYILTNSHRRRLLLKVNARELYHISRLREDATAQWDIRDVAHKMIGLAKKAMPLTFLLIGAKDKYPDIYKNLFGRLPKAIPPKL